MHIDKRIPPGGGLGGGSADAAAVLRWAGVDDLAAAAALGADVPFCLVGGRARVRGIGEVVEPLPFVDRTVTLVMPPLRRQHAGGLPGVGRARRPDRRRARTTSSRRRSPSSRELAAWRDRIGELERGGADAGRQRRDVVRRRASATTPSPRCATRARR